MSDKVAPVNRSEYKPVKFIMFREDATEGARSGAIPFYGRTDIGVDTHCYSRVLCGCIP